MTGGTGGAGGELMNCRVGPETGRLVTTAGLRVRDITATNGRAAVDNMSLGESRATLEMSQATLDVSRATLDMSRATVVRHTD